MAQAVNGRVELENSALDYIRFGGGEKILVMIPGLGDGLRTVKGLARPLSLSYRELAADFTVYMFSRRADGAAQTTREMAADLGRALERLGTGPVCLLGVSLGGMIAQYLAVDHPQLTERLVLAVTAAHVNDVTRQVVGYWTELAKAGDYRALMLDTAEKSYTPARARLYRAVYRLPLLPGKPGSFDRFLGQAAAVTSHDATDELPSIDRPTLIIGGSEDAIVTAEASRELSRLIPGSRLYIYEGLGHAAYEEAGDFNRRLLDFCR